MKHLLTDTAARHLYTVDCKTEGAGFAHLAGILKAADYSRPETQVFGLIAKWTSLGRAGESAYTDRGALHAADFAMELERSRESRRTLQGALAELMEKAAQR